ncbi:serine protease [Planotetraspora thailandica]|uniref:Serine protease n=1 Tax=Planotetraspora thailandica TaxID=487172 RepID=A0A8J3V136_9ACTN|nr:S8/S53 family peptidase [Planotetraspora thailandica]GII54878.1 serine protease [Planotetraspora thailandica]
MRTRLVEHLPDRPALIRPGELLTSSPAACSRWIDDRGGLRLAGPVQSRGAGPSGAVHHVRLSPGVDVLDLTASLRDKGHIASPNHVLVGQPLYFGGPGGRPSPARAVPYEPGEACDVTVGVLDTGLAPHPWLTPWYRDDIAETPDADRDGTLDEQAGHGTFVAGLILREAPGVRLRAIRLLDSHGVSDEAALLRTLTSLRRDPIDVLNLSFGGFTFDDQAPVGLEDALRGFPAVVACAGNTGMSRPFWPAALPGVVAVAALDDEARAGFSAYGPWVDACAQGVGLTSSFVEHESFHGFATWSGTSFATAIVAGRVAAHCRNMPPGEAVRHVLGGGRRIHDLGVIVAKDR